MATVIGLREVRRALRRFPEQVRAELKEGSERLANELKVRIVAAANARGRQSAKAARSVKVQKGAELPVIVAGGPTQAGVLVFGTEFGATRHFGWYARARYYDSRAGQFPPHRGAASYWFFTTVDRNKHAIDAESSMMADNAVRRWAA